MLPDPRPYFSDLADLRRKTRNKLHKQQDIVMIVLCAVISGVMLELTGVVVSIDAIGCQKTMAQKIVGRKADYVLALKDNHRELFEDVKRWLDSEQHA